MLKQWFKDHKITKALDEDGKSVELDDMKGETVYFFHTNQLASEQNRDNWKAFVEGLMPKVETPKNEGVDLSGKTDEELKEYCSEKYGFKMGNNYKTSGMLKKINELGG